MRIGIKKDIDTPPKLANWKTSTAVELCTVRWARISWFKSSPMRASVLPISLTRVLLTLASSYWECPVELFEYPPMKELQRRTIRLYQVISFLLSTNKKESYKRHGQVFIALVKVLLWYDIHSCVFTLLLARIWWKRMKFLLPCYGKYRLKRYNSRKIRKKHTYDLVRHY